MSLDRRTFVRLALGLIASACAAPGLASSAPAVRPNSTEDALLSFLTDPGAASWLGQRYLADHPQEHDANRLADQLMAALSAQSPDQVPDDPIALGQALIALVEQEYASAPLILVDGWPLAPSEARLYALAALATSL